ncbi:MAG: hypothetical protein ACM3TT_13060 [Syntrophothermus sp.]
MKTAAKIVRKRWLWWILCLILAAQAAGCDFKQNPAAANVDKLALRGQAEMVVEGFRRAVEEYNLDGMLSPLAPDFVLTIKERGVAQPDKDKATLKQELEEDEATELSRRKMGYTMKLNFLDLVSIVADDGREATVSGRFTCNEKVSKLFLAEPGTLWFKLIRVGGGWQIQRMILDFNAMK